MILLAIVGLVCVAVIIGAGVYWITTNVRVSKENSVKEKE